MVVCGLLVQRSEFKAFFIRVSGHGDLIRLH